jgi:selenium metabolism protein YedF
MGKEEALGKILMKGFFETMKVYRELPSKMFFVNTGVKLTTINEETVALLKEFDAMGVEIFSCGTCLKYFDLESELKVGFRGGTTNILEGMSDCRKTVWIG